MKNGSFVGKLIYHGSLSYFMKLQDVILDPCC